MTPTPHPCAARARQRLSRCMRKTNSIGEQQEGHRQRRQQPPFGRDQRLDRDRAGQIAGRQHLPAVPDEIERAGEAEQVAHPFEQPADARRQRAQQDVDADVLALPQQPRRRQQREQVEDVLGDLVAPGDAAEAHVARDDVGADQQRHGEQQQARRRHQASRMRPKTLDRRSIVRSAGGATAAPSRPLTSPWRRTPSASGRARGSA